MESCPQYYVSVHSRFLRVDGLRLDECGTPDRFLSLKLIILSVMDIRGTYSSNPLNVSMDKVLPLFNP